MSHKSQRRNFRYLHAYLSTALLAMSAYLLYDFRKPSLFNDNETRQTDSQSDAAKKLASTIVAKEGAANPDTAARTVGAYRRPAMTFEVNVGQVDQKVSFISRTAAYDIFLDADEAIFAFRNDKGVAKSAIAGSSLSTANHRSAKKAQPVLRMKLSGGDSEARATGMDQLPGKVNYFFGNDPTKWLRNISTYAQVRYEHAYPGIDVVYHSNGASLQYDFIVSAGTDPKTIKLDFDGAGKIRVDSTGGLLLNVGDLVVRQSKPIAYQDIQGFRSQVGCDYVINSKGEVGFDLGQYDVRHPLVIDPVLVNSTYIGGAGDEEGRDITVDSTGNVYVTGVTNSLNFPVTSGSYQTSFSGGFRDAFVLKLDTSGQPVYSTYIGGTEFDNNRSIAVDSSTNVYITGNTQSLNFPTTPDAFQPNFGGGTFDGYVTKLNENGELAYSSFLGGSGFDHSGDIEVDSFGCAYVTGWTTSVDFPTANAFRNTKPNAADQETAFVTKFNNFGSSLIYSTYLGGSHAENGRAIAVDADGHAYVLGVALSSDFPVTSNALLTQRRGLDFFVSKFSVTGDSLVYSTFLGGSQNDADAGRDADGDIAVDSAGNAYVTGSTTSSDFPGATNGFRGFRDAFVAELDSTGSSLLYSSYFGSNTNDFGQSIALSSSGRVLISGLVSGNPILNFPLVEPIQSAPGSPRDAFIAEFDLETNTIAFSTFVGGSGDEDDWTAVAVDNNRNAYLTGATDSMNFTTFNAIQQNNAGGKDIFLQKIKLANLPSPPTAVLIDIKPNSFPNSINLGSNGSVPVAILSSSDFDATTVDPLTVTLAGAQIRLTGKGTPMTSTTDVNNDGRLDLIIHVNTAALVLTASDTQATLTGITFNGTHIKGFDSVRVVP